MLHFITVASVVLLSVFNLLNAVPVSTDTQAMVYNTVTMATLTLLNIKI